MSQSVAEYTTEHGGGTFRVGAFGAEPFTPAAGYAVGTVEGTAAFTRDPSTLDAMVRAVAAEHETDYVGTWLDTDTGTYHVDPVRYLRSRRTAMIVARANRQLAIYDFGAADVVCLESEDAE